MRNEDIIKHLMNIRDGCLSPCEKAAVTEAIDIVNDYDKAATLSGRLTTDYETSKPAVKMGENYFTCLPVRETNRIQSHALPLVRTANDMEVGTWD